MDPAQGSTGEKEMNGMKKRFEVAVLVFLFLVLAGVVFAALLPEEVSTEGIITVTSANTSTLT